MSEGTFGWAIERLRDGYRVTRSGWNGRGMFLFFVGKWSTPSWQVAHGDFLPFIAMVTVTGGVVPWLASQTDMLATDWAVV
jgi:hypothetical protein